MTQGFDVRNHEDMPYTLSGEPGLIIEGVLYDGTFSDHQKRLPGQKKYTFTLQRDYVVGGRTFYGNVSITFDNSLADPNPPYLTSLKILCDGKPCDVLSPDAKVTMLIGAEDEQGDISVSAYYFDGSWSPLDISQDKEKYLVEIPHKEDGIARLKVVAADASGNSLSYDFQLPRMIKKRPKSQIENTGNVPLSGTLTLLLQKEYQGQWETYQRVHEDYVSVSPGEHLALDLIWNAQNVQISEPGQYRVYAALRNDEVILTRQGRLEDYWEFWAGNS